MILQYRDYTIPQGILLRPTYLIAIEHHSAIFNLHKTGPYCIVLAPNCRLAYQNDDRQNRVTFYQYSSLNQDSWLYDTDISA